VRGNDVAAHRAAGEQEVVLTDFASGKSENIFSTTFLSPVHKKPVLRIHIDPAIFVIDLQDANKKFFFFL
jgi:hypothetical protein